VDFENKHFYSCLKSGWLNHLKKDKFKQSGGMAELANASVAHTKDQGSNLGIDRKYFLILFVPQLNSNM
jgi:hypothetical protein